MPGAARTARSPTPASRSPPTAGGGAPVSTPSSGGCAPPNSAPGRPCRTPWNAAGEILLSSMDADGTRAGCDTELIRSVRREVTVPVIASGGAGAVEHFPPAVEAGADAGLAASVFHFGVLRIGEVKDALATAGVPVR